MAKEVSQSKIKKSWHKAIPLKELLILLLGSVLTLLGTLWANHLNNSEQFEKEKRDRKFTYIDNYLKDLNQRYYLFQSLVNEIAPENKSHTDIIEIREISRKLDDSRAALNINSLYDKFQFRRYFHDKYYTELNGINNSINDYSQDAEANNGKAVIGLRKISAPILERIRSIETQIYKELDSDK